VSKRDKTLETTRIGKRKSLFDAQDDIDRRRDKLVEEIEAKLKVGYTRETLFEVEWG
jgi:adenine-specific DNA-methyltransferase